MVVIILFIYHINILKKNKDNLIKNFKKIINNFYIERLNKSLLDVIIL